MKTEYNCVKTFKVPKLNDFESNQIRNEDFEITADSNWYCEEPLDLDGVITTDVVMVSEDGVEWIDISRKMFDEHFE